MACQKFLSALADHAAGAEADQVLCAHLATCSACSKELAARKQVLAMVDRELGEVLATQPSPFLAARVRARAIVSSRKLPASAVRTAGRRFAGLLAAAAVIALLAFAVVLGRGEPPVVQVAAESAQETPSVPRVAAPGAVKVEATSVPPAAELLAAAEVTTRSLGASHAAAHDSSPDPSPRVRSDPPESAVAVLAADIKALERFAEILQQGDISPLVEPRDPRIALVQPPPLDLPELRVAELEIPPILFAR